MKKIDHPFCNKIHYQAFAELVICLIPLMMIFVGIWVVAFTGRERIILLNDIRGENEGKYANNLVNGDHFPAILTWTTGGDEVPFTPDDECVTGGEPNMSPFADPLLVGNLNRYQGILTHNIIDRLQGPFFVMAADVKEGRQSTNIFKKYNDNSVEELARKFFYRGNPPQLEEFYFTPIIGRGI